MNVLLIIYLLSSVSFILGLKMLAKPNTARLGNLIAAAGMGIAIIATIFLNKTAHGEALHNYVWIFAAITIGSVLGWLSAKKVKMTAMPEMVSLFNGMGGACAALISIGEWRHYTGNYGQLPKADNVRLFYENLPTGSFITIVAGLIIGCISFSGSIIAWGKLNGKIKDFRYKGQQIVNLTLFFVILLFAALMVYFLPHTSATEGLTFTLSDGTVMQYGMFNIEVYSLYVLAAIAIIYGILFVLPIGGADMPVVISLLNSLTGMAAACGGFLYGNKVMLTGGILVGAAGTLLTILMCKAMNRSLTNVLLGNFGNASSGTGDGSGIQGNIKEVTLNDAAVLIRYSNNIIIVPGYGLAVAQAQHTCHELEKLLTSYDINVTYAIHPVAGRMPGHMNVLLAEADVAYEKLEEMEQANEKFSNTDVVLILGANDVVNPAAKTNPASPIYGMPILDVNLAKNIIVNKRSMKPGYAGIENELFYEPKTSMLFGDAKKVLQDLTTAIKEA
jgi:H+-translocating NAD(P) transhydrogenase subunit beta